MERAVFLSNKLNSKGMTLIEMLIALLILLVTSLAMMSTALLGLRTNLGNSLRSEALSVAEARMNELRNEQFNASGTSSALNPTGATGVSDGEVSRRLRAAEFSFARSRTVADINADMKQVTVTVTWNYRGGTYRHAITSILRRLQ